MFFSPRGHPLVHIDEARPEPTVTVENYIKWYELFLVNPDGSVRAVTFEEMEEHAVALRTCATGDHVFNPAVVERMAQANGWCVDECSWNMIVGRWVEEYLNLDSGQLTNWTAPLKRWVLVRPGHSDFTGLCRIGAGWGSDVPQEPLFASKAAAERYRDRCEPNKDAVPVEVRRV